jgi:hypothetical protein
VLAGLVAGHRFSKRAEPELGKEDWDPAAVGADLKLKW